MKLHIGDTVQLSKGKPLVVGAMPAKWVIRTADGFLTVTPKDSEYVPLGLYRPGSDQVQFVLMQSPNKNGGHNHTMHRAEGKFIAQDGAEIFDCEFIETTVFRLTKNSMISIDL